MRCHMFGRSEGEELNEGDLHGEEGSQDVEDVVGRHDLAELLFLLSLMRDHGEEHEDRDDVDDEGVSSPRSHHVEVS